MNHTQKNPEFVHKWIDLAQPRLGSKPIFCTDEFFAACERMLKPEAAVFIDGKFDDNGKWMDGWETRRRRNGGHDHAIIQLGHPGIIHGIDMDTSHFTGNYPPAASLEACSSKQEPDESTNWVTLVPAQDLQGNSHHYYEVNNDQVWTHLRLSIFPDGGIARLRVYGEIQCNWADKDQSKLHDLVAMENGGRPIAWNDEHYGQVSNLIAPGRGVNMGDGWETRRRREPGNDWCIIALGTIGTIKEAIIDTAYFKGNFPDQCSIQAASVPGGTDASLVTQSMFWQELLPPQKLGMDSEHHFKTELIDIGPVTHIRLNIFPDGGISRIRLLGLSE